MAIVSNTSPLLNLAIIDQLHLLHQQFPNILVPEAVTKELQLETNWLGTIALQAAFSDGWIQSSPVNNRHLAQSLLLDLDKGEAEAISLALERSSPIILLDEREGRTAAKLLGLQPIGVLGILLRAKSLNAIIAIEPLIQKLKEDAGFFISTDLERAILQSAGELP